MVIPPNEDVLYHIFSQLTPETLKQVSQCCRLFDKVCAKLLFNHLTITWADVDQINLEESIDRRFLYTTKVSILSNGRGEWDSSPCLYKLQKATSGLLNTMQITCAMQSSGWFKYITPLNCISCLILNTSLKMHNFDFAHVSASLPNLEMITLGDLNGGFVIDPQIQTGLKRLKRLKIVNCEWKYPAKLSDCCKNSKLLFLELIYTTKMHPFAFSERFRSEFMHLPRSLKSLKVHVDVGMPINWSPLGRSRALPNLEVAELKGFEFHLNMNKERRKFPKLRVISDL